MNENEMLLEQDLVWTLRRVPKDVFKLMKESGKKLFLAGGFIRDCVCGDRPSDIDLFSDCAVTARLAAENLASKRQVKMVSTVNAYTVCGPGLSVQFIHKWVFAKPEDVIPSFDFTVARAAVWYDQDIGKWVSRIDSRFYADLAAKRLTYCYPKWIEEAGGSMLRVLKFYRRGYRVPLDSLAGVIARLDSGVDRGQLENSAAWNNEGPEEKYARIVTGLLREVDPNIDPTGQAHLPSSKDTEEETVEETDA